MDSQGFQRGIVQVLKEKYFVGLLGKSEEMGLSILY